MFDFIRSYARREEDSEDMAFQKRLLIIVSMFLLLCGIVWTLMYYLMFGWTIPAIAAAIFALNAVVSMLVSQLAAKYGTTQIV